MLRISRILFQQNIKRTTGLVGLDVVPDARNVLIKLYEKTLRDVKVRFNKYILKYWSRSII